MSSVAAEAGRPDVYREVADEVRTWANSDGQWSNGWQFRVDMRRFLRRLTRSKRYRSEDVSFRSLRGRHDVDFAIGDAIGIKIVYSLTGGSKQYLARELALVGNKYQMVIVIGFRLSTKHMDVWRNTEKKVSSRTGSTNYVFVSADWESSSTTSRESRSMIHLTHVAFLAFLVGATAFGVKFYTMVDGLDVLAQGFAGSVAAFLLAFCLFTLFFVRYL